MKRQKLLIFALLITLQLSGCQVAEEVTELSDESVTIAYAEPITDYSPFSNSAKDRKYLANIYDPLVRYDKTFNPETSLAVAWGRIDDVTWEFRLREGVIFHDGSVFDAEDAIYSHELAGFESVSSSESYRVQITTAEPDPLLLSRLVNVYMVPKDYKDFITPNGTGPYYVSGFENQSLILQRFDYYWGKLPYFAEARLLYQPDLKERYAALLSGEIDLLANVPPQYVNDLEAGGIEIVDFPSLESSFLIFNDGGIFADEALRSAAWSGLGSTYADTLGGGYLMPTTQYAASGIMGYISGGLPDKRDLAILDERVAVTLDLPEGIAVLGDMIVEDLYSVGFDVTVNSLPLPEYEEKIYSGASDLFFFGWKYDLADASEFFEAVVHSGGEFNNTGYSDFELDELIDTAAFTLDLSERRELLEIIARTYFDDQVAYPLFESQVLYGIHPSIDWEVRLDGLILASEITKNMVE